MKRPKIGISVGGEQSFRATIWISSADGVGDDPLMHSAPHSTKKAAREWAKEWCRVAGAALVEKGK